MTLTATTRLGPYEVIAPLGAGGMGEVYKGRDTRLERTVAIKILPGELAGDPQFRDRFDREAKTISALNHPNICTLYDVGEAVSPALKGGPPGAAVRYLVLEYLEGETLAARLDKGPLPLPDALRIGLDILNALEAAHRHGVVHRDLKPGNVMLTKSGAKLLDFGLAKTTPLVTSVNPMAPTLTAGTTPLTAQGTILGTFQYMAPEQMEGEAADARTDLFAFGAVLYEMITGRRAFTGKTQASLVGAILKEDPPPVSQTQAVAPPALDHLVRTCLAKDPDARYQTAHDAKIQLTWIAQGGSGVGLPAPIAAKRRTRERVAWSIAAVLGAIAMAAASLAIVHLREVPPRAERVELTIAPDEGQTIGLTFAVSPDGRHVVFATNPVSPDRTLWIRSLASQTTRPLRGSEGGGFPFWSADSRSVGFFAQRKLKTIDVNGGTPIPLCDTAAPPGGGAWNRDNLIVFAPSTNAPLHRVNAAGGPCTPLTTLAAGEISHHSPWFLPDGRSMLFLAARPVSGSNQLFSASLDAAGATPVGRIESAAVYASGHLLFGRAGALMAQPFDATSLRTTGDPFMVTPEVSVAPSGRVALSASSAGVLAYARGAPIATSRLTWTDRAGAPLGVVGEPGAYSNVNLSRDDRRLVVSLTTGLPVNRDIWVIDLTRADTMSRRSFNAAVEADPVFSPSGDQIVYNSNRNTTLYNTLYLKPDDASGQETELVKMERLTDSPDWSHDGQTIVFTGGLTGASNDLWLLPLSGDRKPRVFFESTFAEDSPAFSPDDRRIAYNSDLTGRVEVYVRDVAGGREVRVSRDGGWSPRWRGDGKEMFFLGLDGTMMAVDITVTAKGIEAGVPRALFPTPLRRVFDRRPYAVTHDGKRFLFPVPAQRQTTIPLTVVVNWLSPPQR